MATTPRTHPVSSNRRPPETRLDARAAGAARLRRRCRGDLRRCICCSASAATSRWCTPTPRSISSMGRPAASTSRAFRTGSSRRCRRSARSICPGPGYASLGMIYEEGKDLPVGMSKRHYQGIDRTFLNCAVCHTSTVRDTPQSKPHVYTRRCRRTRSTSWGSRNSSSPAARIRKFSQEYVDPRSAAPCSSNAARISICSTATSSIRSRCALMRERLLMLAGRFAWTDQQHGLGPGPRRHVQRGQGAVQLPDGSSCPSTR